MLPIRSRFLLCLFCHSTPVRLRRGRSRHHSSSSSSRSLQLQPHQHCFERRRHGLLVVLLVLCDTCSVAALLLLLCDSCRVVEMYLLHSSCRDHRAFSLWCVCVASPHNTGQLRCGSFTTTRERIPPSLVLVSPGTLLLRAASGVPRSRSKSDTYRRTCHIAPCSLFFCHSGVGNNTFIKSKQCDTKPTAG